MRKFLVRWWQTPEWNEEWRRRKIFEWRALNGDAVLEALKVAFSKVGPHASI